MKPCPVPGCTRQAKEAAGVSTLTATCIVTNCRKHAPADEPFCKDHR